MTTTTKAILALVIAAVVAGGVYGGYKFLFYKPQIVAGTSTQGGTGSTARQYNVYGVNLAAPGANATSSSILNTTGNDLYVTALKVGCEGVGTSQTAYTGTGLASLTLKAATSSTASTPVNGNTFLAGSITISTSSSQFVEASSTASSGSNSVNYVWLAGSYMNFWTNATNTAVCTFGVDAFSS
jgi:hypothetical protein